MKVRGLFEFSQICWLTWIRPFRSKVTTFGWPTSAALFSSVSKMFKELACWIWVIVFNCFWVFPDLKWDDHLVQASFNWLRWMAQPQVLSLDRYDRQPGRGQCRFRTLNVDKVWGKQPSILGTTSIFQSMTIVVKRQLNISLFLVHSQPWTTWEVEISPKKFSCDPEPLVGPFSLQRRRPAYLSMYIYIYTVYTFISI